MTAQNGDTWRQNAVLHPQTPTCPISGPVSPVPTLASSTISHLTTHILGCKQVTPCSQGAAAGVAIKPSLAQGTMFSVTNTRLDWECLSGICIL